MTTSGSYDFSLTAAQLCTRALKNLRILAAGQTIGTNDQTDLLQTLNVIAKELQGNALLSRGLMVHTRQRISLVLAKGQQSYLIGPASTNANASTLLGRTTISADEAAAQTVISITSNTDTTSYPGTTITMAASDFVGVALDDGTIQWTTISGTPAATMTIAAALTGPASSGNSVFWFTSRAQRFPVLEAAVCRDSQRDDYALDVYREVSDYEIDNPSKFVASDPSWVLVEPIRLATRITLDAQPADLTKTVVLTALYPAEDYDTSTDDIAFPQEWLGYLEWELTLRSASAYSVAWTPVMDMNYKNAMSVAKSLNPEISNAYYQPDAPT